LSDVNGVDAVVVVIVADDFVVVGDASGKHFIKIVCFLHQLTN
jgi:hypothetical protein